jgi:O-antigen ligase
VRPSIREWAPGESGPGGSALRVAQVALLVLAFSVPFSIAITEGALVVGLIAIGISRARGRRFAAPSSWLLPASLALAGAWLLSSAFSAEPADSFYHARKLYALGLILLAAEAGREPRVRARALVHLVAGSLVTALLGFIIYAIRVPAKPDYRLQSVLSNQMTSGGVLSAAVLWSLAAAAAQRGRGRLLYALAALPLGTALVLTQTRSHWLGTAAGIAAILIALAPRWGWLAPLAAIAGLRFAPARLAARFASILDPHEPGNQGRLSMWRSARDIIRDHPVIGVGCQDLLQLYRRYRYPDWTFESGHFHNNFIQIAVMTGAVGSLAFLFWLIAAARELGRGLKAARPGADHGMAVAGIALFVALLVSGMFDYTFGDAEVVYHTFLALGFALAIQSAARRESPRGLDGPARGD